MAVTPEANGTQTAIIGTEHTLHENAGAKVFVLKVNTKNMVNGDEVELRIYDKVLTGSPQDLAYFASYAHIQAEKVKPSIPIPAEGFTVGFKATLKQTVGTGRAFEWSVVSIG